MDKDLDGIPNNFDLDSDNDGIPDTGESFGVDANGDSLIDNYSDSDAEGLSQNVDASGPGATFLYGSGLGLGDINTDGDRLDDRFDANNTNAEATSPRMGNGGTTTGDPTPGSITPVQHTVSTHGCPSERDWRCVPYILSCKFITFNAFLQGQLVQKDWTVLCRQEVD